MPLGAAASRAPPRSQPQAGQRRAELVRGVGDELGLRAQRAGEPLGHDVERAGERPLLAAALDPRAGVEVAGRDPVGGGAELLDRARDPTREQERGEQRHEQHAETDGDDPHGGAPDGVVDGVDALRQAHRAHDAPGDEHRPGGGEDVLVERVGAALVLERAAVQRGGQLRTAGEVDADRFVGAVGEHAAACVDDHDARPRRAADRLGGVAQRARVAGLDQPPAPAASTAACVRPGRAPRSRRGRAG